MTGQTISVNTAPTKSTAADVGKTGCGGRVAVAPKIAPSTRSS